MGYMSRGEGEKNKTLTFLTMLALGLSGSWTLGILADVVGLHQSSRLCSKTSSFPDRQGAASRLGGYFWVCKNLLNALATGRKILGAC